MNKIIFEVRNATSSDFSGISELTGQLGYSVTDHEIQDRINSILSSNDHVIYVALIPNGKIVGWIHVHESKRIESGSFAEIGGFVVSATFRRRGIGKSLLKSAEQWAETMRLKLLRVRSKIEREDAKRFYSNMGFIISKQQRVFDKIMNYKA